MNIVTCINKGCNNKFELGKKGKPGLYRECSVCGQKRESSQNKITDIPSKSGSLARHPSTIKRLKRF